MTWEPGLPVLTESDQAEWQAWRKERKLELQRWRRSHWKRIDYSPDRNAEAIIEAEYASRGSMASYGSVIDSMVEEWASFRNKVRESDELL